ncbi:N-acetylglucosamine kinase [Leifsonia poae]|uniref:N-acetylglucosamine kinase n=1 Tax=Leifsonia poae TaxID=110933 RepID=UPI001CBCD337|nr:BadF/BadG/BcrA/BcrD ATPase family protein [Leifsonia poae]
MSHVVGVDIGGTKTHLVLAPVDPVEESVSPLREIVVPSSSWRNGLGDAEADASGLRELVIEYLGAEALSAPLAVGAHGCENTAQCHELELALLLRFAGPVVVMNDSELIPPAMGHDRAIGVVVGTGSIATARDANAELVTAGGWGWLLGDEGSAAGLVREATRAVLRDLDRGRPVEQLGRRLFASFSARNGDELALAVTEAASAEEWGGHAPEVFSAADEGSVLAADVIAEAGSHLAGLVHRLRERGIPADSIVAGGSVIQRQPRLQEAFGAALAVDHAGLPLIILDRAPVLGAVQSARGLAHGTTTTP